MSQAMSQAVALNQKARLPFWRQLRWNLIIYFVILAVLPVIVVQAITLSLTTQNARNAVTNQLESVATIKANQLQRWTAEVDNSMTILLGDPVRYNEIAELLTSSAANSTFQAEVNRYLQSVVTQTTAAAGSTAPIFKNLFVYDLQGNVVAGSADELVSRIVNRQPYFTASFKSAYLQPPFYTLDTNQLTMVYTEPVVDATQKNIGVIAGTVDISTLRQIMTERAGLGDTGETYLVSAENNYLLTPSRFDGYPLDQAYHSQGIDTALSGKNGAGVYQSYRGGSVIGVYQWLPELHVALLAEIDQSEALAAARQVLSASLIVTIAAALIAIAIGFFRISQISAPIAALTQIATRIAAGDLTQRAKVKEQNEIGLLATSFNAMTEQLVSNINQLDQTVQEIGKTNKALQIATAKAKEAARVKGEFLANVSHELRTPLNAIIGFSDMLLAGMSGPLNPKQQHKIERLRENGSRLLTLINDLLDLTRIEAGRLEMLQNEYAPSAMVERIAAQMESLADTTKLKFVTNIDSNLPPMLMGDEKRTEQVVVNLLSNAFKFTKEGGITLYVGANPANKTWTIEVTDTGIGIPPHALNVIFEEFRQLDGSYSRAYKGTGLGLAITRNLVRMMEGKITVKSTLGTGSTFSVVLPLVMEAEPMLESEGVEA